MFDSVGRNIDEEAAARSAKASFITLLISGGVALGVVAAGMWKVREIIIEPPSEEIVEIAMEEEADMEAPPPPPPPPPPPAAASASEEADDDPTPDEMTEKVEELKEEVKQEIKSDVKPAGVEGGVEGGVVGGVVGGVQGGVVGGVVGGQLGGTGGAPKVIHQSEIEWKKKVDPAYPVAARGLNLGEQSCRTKVYLDEAGVPYKLDIDDTCPKVFHEEIRNALLKWRSYPYKVDKLPIKVQSTILVRFREA